MFSKYLRGFAAAARRALGELTSGPRPSTLDGHGRLQERHVAPLPRSSARQVACRPAASVRYPYYIMTPQHDTMQWSCLRVVALASEMRRAGEAVPASPNLIQGSLDRWLCHCSTLCAGIVPRATLHNDSIAAAAALAAVPAAFASFAGAFLTTWPAMGGSAPGVTTSNLVALVET